MIKKQHGETHCLLSLVDASHKLLIHVSARFNENQPMSARKLLHCQDTYCLLNSRQLEQTQKQKVVGAGLDLITHQLPSCSKRGKEFTNNSAKIKKIKMRNTFQFTSSFSAVKIKMKVIITHQIDITFEFTKCKYCCSFFVSLIPLQCVCVFFLITIMRFSFAFFRYFHKSPPKMI